MPAAPHLEQWLKEIYPHPVKLKDIPGDASCRHYFRVSLPETQVIAVDASKEPQANRQFCELSRLFRQQDINTPKILHNDLAQGYSVISDFGDDLYLKVINEENADALYFDALNTLVKLQPIDSKQLPIYSETMLIEEAELFRTWYLDRHIGITLSQQEITLWHKALSKLIIAINKQPYVCVHRDYHSRNLLYLKQNSPGVIDFQDAVKGPITYDAVSLLKDCYIKWPEQKIMQWLEYFYSELKLRHQVNVSFAEFQKWFDLMGVQRHLKAIGIFARLHHRDGKTTYLKDIPRTMSYIIDVCQKYDFLTPFKYWLAENIPDTHTTFEETTQP